VPRHPSAVQQEVRRHTLPPGLDAPPCSLKPAPMVARLQPLGVLLPLATEHRLLVFLADLTFPLSSNGEPFPGRTFARCSWSLPARPQRRLAMAPPCYLLPMARRISSIPPWPAPLLLSPTPPCCSKWCPPAIRRNVQLLLQGPLPFPSQL
jgi:hypothetical protein